MSDPQDPTNDANTPAHDDSADQPTEVYGQPSENPAQPTSDSDQPTEVYGQPVSSDQPTEAYGQPIAGGATPPPYDVAPGVVPPAPPAPGPAGAAAYGAPYAAPTYPAPKGPDSRPKTLGWIALAAGALTFVLAIAALFLMPAPGVAVTLAVIALVLGLVGVILGIVVLVNSAQGNKGGAVGGLVASVIGGGMAIVALLGALIWFSVTSVADELSSNPPVAPSPSVEQTVEPPIAPSDEPDGALPDDDELEAPVTGDEAAYLEAVRPALLAVMQEVEPTLTSETFGTIYTDDTLVLIGQSVLSMEQMGQLDTMREQMADGLAVGGFSEEQADRFVDAILSAAQEHLAG